MRRFTVECEGLKGEVRVNIHDCDDVLPLAVREGMLVIEEPLRTSYYNKDRVLAVHITETPVKSQSQSELPLEAKP